MNTIKSIALAFAVSLLAAPVAATAQAQGSSRAAPIAADVVVEVNGLVCDFCAQSIDRSFRRRAEVNDVRVDLTTKLVTIDFRANQNLDDTTLRQIITNAGYTVVEVRRTGGGS